MEAEVTFKLSSVSNYLVKISTATVGARARPGTSTPHIVKGDVKSIICNA